MLVIRAAQMTRLANAMERSFERDMAVHLRTHFPERVESLNDNQLLERISLTLDRARLYELSAPADQCRFLNLAAACGWEFDEQPENAWMREYLTDPGVSSPSNRIALLTDEHLRRVQIEKSNEELRRRFANKP